MAMITCKSVDELDVAATRLLVDNSGKRLFAIYGRMGAGKTTLIKALCNQLETIDLVNSPTFAIVNEYRTERDESLYHFDFYRIKNETEAFHIGLEEYLYSGDYCFIEWPEKIERLLPDEVITVTITVNENDKSRMIEWKKGKDN